MKRKWQPRRWTVILGELKSYVQSTWELYAEAMYCFRSLPSDVSAETRTAHREELQQATSGMLPKYKSYLSNLPMPKLALAAQGEFTVSEAAEAAKGKSKRAWNTKGKKSPKKTRKLSPKLQKLVNTLAKLPKKSFDRVVSEARAARKPKKAAK